MDIHEVNTPSSDLVSQIDDVSRNLNMLINRGAMVREQCSFYGVMGHSDANCG